MAAARADSLLVIADAKRGDIGTTMDAYAAAWFTPGSPLEADALTVNPYLGVGSLETAFALAARHGKGTFVLATTSNPDAETLQRSVDADGRTVSAGVISQVSAANAANTPDGAWGSNGFVIGATVDWDAAGISAFEPPAPILGPGFGAQGAGPADLRARYGTAAELVLASESRSILSAGPDDITAAITSTAAEYREVLRG
jgi:orotidine-5'-phosphate decarboxylase